jgi:hypothetical protein
MINLHPLAERRNKIGAKEAGCIEQRRTDPSQRGMIALGKDPFVTPPILPMCEDQQRDLHWQQIKAVQR